MRIAHLSDFHMRHHLPGAPKNPHFRNWEIPTLLEPIMARLATLRLDLLVASGDLIDYPLDEMDNSQRQAQAIADLSRLRELLSLAECPLALVPGNHDHPDVFQEVFGDLSQDFICAGHRVLTFYDAEDADHVPHRRAADRMRFNHALASGVPDPLGPQEAPLPQIHIQHFLIWPQINEDYPYNYPDADTMLEQMAASHRVSLSLAGHYHAGVEPTNVHGVTFAGVPAFCEPPHPVWIYDLTDTGITKTVLTSLSTHS